MISDGGKFWTRLFVDATGVDIIEITNKDENTVTTTYRQIIVQERGPRPKDVLVLYSD